MIIGLGSKAMNRHIIFLLISVGFPSLAAARFDETTVACDHRYGKPTTVKVVGADQVRWYRKSDYSVEAVFSKGRAVEIFYSRIDGQGLKNEELYALLRFNMGEAKWRKVDQVAQCTAANNGKPLSEAQQNALMEDMSAFVLFRRTDERAEASYARDDGVLFIGDTKRLEEARKSARRERNIPASLQGF